MKLNIEDVLEERNKIVHSFCIPMGHTPLIIADLVDHKHQIEKVYKGMLREGCVIDDCCRRFKMMFRGN